MAASLTITFDENKYHLMIQEKQSKRAYKRPASCRSVSSPSNSQNTRSTSTPQTIIFGSLGPFPLPVEETAPTKKQKTAPQRVTTPTPKAVAKKPEARGNPAKPQPAKNQVCPKTWSRDLHQKKEGPGHLQSQHTWLLSRRTGSILLLTSKERNLPTTELPKQLSTSRLVHTSPKSSRASQGLDKNLPGLLSCNSTLHLNRGKACEI